MRCPVCNAPVDLSRANRFRPFCSERCRLTDLGRWAQEEYRIAGEREECQAEGDEESINGDRSNGNKSRER
jgi:endogenous inhibitor of DNA gyrase (YacG/DUF329 family)